MITPVLSAQFRVDFPEFTDSVKYPDSVVTFWLKVASKLINECRWGDSANLGSELFAAHNIVLEAQAMQQVAFGGLPGLSPGILNSKSVDKVASGYDTANAALPGAGHWNLTVYGTRYRYFAGLFGAGGIQLGVPPDGSNTPLTPSYPYPYY